MNHTDGRLAHSADCTGPDHYGDHSGRGGCGGFGPTCACPAGTYGAGNIHTDYCPCGDPGDCGECS